MQGGGAFFGKIREGRRIQGIALEERPSGHTGPVGRGSRARGTSRESRTGGNGRERIRGLAETAARARQEGEGRR